MTAIDLIRNERNEQIHKHGFTDAKDDRYKKQELYDAAMAVLLEDPTKWPAAMPTSMYFAIVKKPNMQRLVAGAALLAAHIDSLIRIERKKFKPAVDDKVKLVDHLYVAALRAKVDHDVAVQLAPYAGHNCVVLDPVKDQAPDQITVAVHNNGTITIPLLCVEPIPAIPNLKKIP